MTNITLPRAELQQVLEAMENFGTDWDGWHRAYMALRERLAQPEQPNRDYWEEEARRYAGNADYWRGVAKRLEPVAWEDVLGAIARGWTHDDNKHKQMDVQLAVAIAKEIQDMVTAPAQPSKPWVGLTTDEVYRLHAIAIANNRVHLESRRGKQLSSEDERIAFYARALEAKLKEKNT